MVLRHIMLLLAALLLLLLPGQAQNRHAMEQRAVRIFARRILPELGFRFDRTPARRKSAVVYYDGFVQDSCYGLNRAPFWIGFSNMYRDSANVTRRLTEEEIHNIRPLYKRPYLKPGCLDANALTTSRAADTAGVRYLRIPRPLVKVPSARIRQWSEKRQEYVADPPYTSREKHFYLTACRAWQAGDVYTVDMVLCRIESVGYQAMHDENNLAEELRSATPLYTFTVVLDARGRALKDWWYYAQGFGWRDGGGR